MTGLRAQHQCPKRPTQRIDLGGQAIFFDHGGECGRDILEGGGGLYLKAHEKAASVVARKLLGLGDVAVCLNQGATDRVDNAWLVITREGDDEVGQGFLHVPSVEPLPRGSTDFPPALWVSWWDATGAKVDHHRGA